ncbi:hypothetical protein CTEST_11280 [Corynebacterium testudinoris]|uniref:Uncharacterized protein n=1 Tax=Corynebacterium testudinoris TaxID=136857 RepID=A0A0G3H8J5_9CORY|nr:hypothetical protein CTEST_11280 [Corynebacterium testudinoris]
MPSRSSSPTRESTAALVSEKMLEIDTRSRPRMTVIISRRGRSVAARKAPGQAAPAVRTVQAYSKAVWRHRS